MSSKKTSKTNTKKRATLTLTLTSVAIKGTVRVHLWGGGIASLTMDTKKLPLKYATKDNILRCVNDGGFGVEAITSASIDIYYDYQGTLCYERTIIVVSPVHTKLFNGWKELQAQNIYI